MILALLVLSSWLAYRSEQDRARAEYERAQGEYRPAVLKLAGQLAAAEFRMQEGVAARAGSIALPFGTLTPVTEQDLRRIAEADALESVREAAEELERLMVTLPDKRDGHYQLARAHELLGQEDKAREAALCALEIDENFLPARAILEPMGELILSTGDGWVAHWARARQAMGEKGAETRDWPTAERAYSALIDQAERDDEPYVGLLLEAYMGRGVARLGKKDCLGAVEDFSAARLLARSSLEPALLLGKTYLVQGEGVRAQSTFEDALRAVPPVQRDETALWVAIVHVSRTEYRDALAWAEWIHAAGLRERLRSYLYLQLDGSRSAVEAGKAAVDAEPENVTGHVLVCSALLERSRAPPAGCDEYLELLDATSRAREVDPENRDLGFLLRVARERVRSYVDTVTRRETMTLQTRCFRSLMALAFALGVTASSPAVGQEIFENFVEDPDPFDGEPLMWAVTEDGCCPAEVDLPGDDGLCFRPTGRGTGGLWSQEVFAGDVTFRVEAGIARGIDAILHWDLVQPSGYLGFITPDEDCNTCDPGLGLQASLVIWDNGTIRLQLRESLGFDPASGDVVLEVRSVGPFVELRAWPVGEPRPAAPLIQTEDDRHRVGVVAIGAWTGGTTCVRSARITATPPLPPFLRGDCNADGTVDISDVTCALDWLFAGAAAPSCQAALNANGDDKVDIADPVALLNFLFAGGPMISDPYPECGPGELDADQTLGCEVPPNC